MATNELAVRNGTKETAIEAVVAKGDLKDLTPTERINYYRAVCESVGLNPLTKPFEYVSLSGKLTLYARKDATDQLRRINGVSLGKPTIQYQDDILIVSIDAMDRNGRTDFDIGAVSVTGLKGEAKANAIMKAITKAKRRVTLSIVGLGWLDESEISSVPDAQRVVVAETGEIIEAAGNTPTPTQPGADVAFDDDTPSPTLLKTMHATGRELYGEAWDEKRPQLVRSVTKGRTTSSKELTEAEAVRLIEGMGDKLRAAAEAQPALVAVEDAPAKRAEFA